VFSEGQQDPRLRLASMLGTRRRREFIAMMPIAGAQWEGLRLKAELEVKGMRYPCAGRAVRNSIRMAH
jgi:hypothetical protein